MSHGIYSVDPRSRVEALYPQHFIPMMQDAKQPLPARPYPEVSFKKLAEKKPATEVAGLNI